MYSKRIKDKGCFITDKILSRKKEKQQNFVGMNFCVFLLISISGERRKCFAQQPNTQLSDINGIYLGDVFSCSVKPTVRYCAEQFIGSTLKTNQLLERGICNFWK
jgi:hypothetical protein